MASRHRRRQTPVFVGHAASPGPSAPGLLRPTQTDGGLAMTAGYQAAELEVTITRRTRRTESATELPHLRSQFATLKKGDPCCLEKDSARRLLRFVICSPLDTPRGLGRGYLFCGQDEARLRRYRDPCRGVGGRLAAARLLPRLLLDGLVAMTAGLSSDAWNLSRRAAFAGSVGLRGFDLYHFAHRGRPRHLAAFALQVADVAARSPRGSV